MARHSRCRSWGRRSAAGHRRSSAYLQTQQAGSVVMYFLYNWQLLISIAIVVNLCGVQGYVVNSAALQWEIIEAATAPGAPPATSNVTSSSNSYQNFTVGDTQGWGIPTAKDAYQKWADGKKFALGDFLLFSYPTQQHNVVVTQNATVYKTCSDWRDANDDDIDVWGEPGNTTYSAIPLVKTGMTYFFCGANFGTDHCLEGMKFAVNVSYGAGLPPSLMVPPPGPVDDGTPAPPDDDGSDLNFDIPPPPPPPSESFSAPSLHFLPFLAAALFLSMLLPANY